MGEGVYIHGKVATKAQVGISIGNRVTFNLHISKVGRPQASSPKNAGGARRKGGYADAPAAKRQRTEYAADKGCGKGCAESWDWAGGKDKTYGKAFAKGWEKAAKDPGYAKG